MASWVSTPPPPPPPPPPAPRERGNLSNIRALEGVAEHVNARQYVPGYIALCCARILKRRRNDCCLLPLFSPYIFLRGVKRSPVP